MLTDGDVLAIQWQEWLSGIGVGLIGAQLVMWERDGALSAAGLVFLALGWLVGWKAPKF